MAETEVEAFHRMWSREPISDELAAAAIEVATAMQAAGQPPCVAVAMASRRIYPDLESRSQAEINQIMPPVLTSLLAAEHVQRLRVSGVS